MARPIFWSSGIGTGGTITGVGEVVKPASPPSSRDRGGAGRLADPLGRAEGPASLQGIGAGFVPDVLEHRDL